LLPTAYQQFIAVSRYARWLDDQGRRETWDETVNRYVDFMVESLKKNHDYEVYSPTVAKVRNAILNLDVMPSMRALMTAGPALERENLASFNCSFVAIDHPRSFDEALYVLMNGTGLGFSVESKYVSQLPGVPENFEKTDTTIVVADSKAGWARSYKELLAMLWAGEIPNFDLSKVRPAGSRLKTFGGRASGPEPLQALFDFTVKKFITAKGRKLKPIECHDLMCKIADVVVVGGVRRSALISLSDLNDYEMSKAKSGEWWIDNPQRRLANNTAVYYDKPTVGEFLREWSSLYESKSGERGIFNMGDVRRKESRRDMSKIAGLNPCAEIFLRHAGLCNLSEIVVKPDDTVDSLLEKAEIAATIGTWQSTLTNFKYVRRIWKENAEEERLLGVSLTGIFGNPLTSGRQGLENLQDLLNLLRTEVRATNEGLAQDIGINPSVATTAIKPSGTVSQLTGVSSGIHPWHDDFYARTVRGDNKDPMTEFMKDIGIKNEPDLGSPDSTTVFYFPVEAPANAVTRDDLTAVQHLEIWKVYKKFWTEHNPSITVNIREDEWISVAKWVYENWSDIAGISFLPYSDHTYKQAPYTDVSREEFVELLSETPSQINWNMLSAYEHEDGTSGSQELACVAGQCELVDIQ
jgi:ribonucleoside-triphosphate reductase (thioredoxin)